ncbi:MAG: PH domain-containing protein [Lachnospiraceae bacterium]|nr:PH domain-containing protein [Lachnospiraceae bacterium]MDD3659869.1 PH domain-containing protein [Lachnospiraceae bacterium]
MQFIEKKRILLFGLPWTFTRYTIKDDMITIDSGFLNKEENDCYMYKVQDVRLKLSFLERIMGLGTIECFTGDSTNPTLQLTHIKNSKVVKDFILQASEEARRKRRTLNTLDISADGSEELIDQ